MSSALSRLILASIESKLAICVGVSGARRRRLVEALAFARSTSPVAMASWAHSSSLVGGGWFTCGGSGWCCCAGLAGPGVVAEPQPCVAPCTSWRSMLEPSTRGATGPPVMTARESPGSGVPVPVPFMGLNKEPRENAGPGFAMNPGRQTNYNHCVATVFICNYNSLLYTSLY